MCHVCLHPSGFVSWYLLWIEQKLLRDRGGSNCSSLFFCDIFSGLIVDYWMHKTVACLFFLDFIFRIDRLLSSLPISLLVMRTAPNSSSLHSLASWYWFVSHFFSLSLYYWLTHHWFASYLLVVSDAQNSPLVFIGNPQLESASCKERSWSQGKTFLGSIANWRCRRQNDPKVDCWRWSRLPFL